MSEMFYWIATNGASVAAQPMAIEGTPYVWPTPQQLIGFRTLEEQQEAQMFLLTAPIEEVGEYMASLPPRIKRGEVAYIRPTDPEPPTRGPTCWVSLEELASKS